MMGNRRAQFAFIRILSSHCRVFSFFRVVKIFYSLEKSLRARY